MVLIRSARAAILLSLLGVSACSDDSRPSHAEALRQIEAFNNTARPKTDFISPFVTDAYTYDNGISIDPTHYKVFATLTQRWSDTKENGLKAIVADTAKFGSFGTYFDKQYMFSKGDIYKTEDRICIFVKTERGWLVNQEPYASAHCVFGYP